MRLCCVMSSWKTLRCPHPLPFLQLPLVVMQDMGSYLPWRVIPLVGEYGWMNLYHYKVISWSAQTSMRRPLSNSGQFWVWAHGLQSNLRTSIYHVTHLFVSARCLWPWYGINMLPETKSSWLTKWTDHAFISFEYQNTSLLLSMIELWRLAG